VKTRTIVWGAVIALLVTVLVGFGSKAVASSCTTIRPADVSVFNNDVIYTKVYAERCGDKVWIIDILSASTGVDYKIKSAEIFRYKYDGSKGGVRSANVPVDGITTNGHSIHAWKTIPSRAKGHGWSGYVRLVLVVNNETRPINLKL
jgi:hypothetical protein